MPPRIPLRDPGTFGPFINSFRLHLRGERKSDKTVRGYLDCATKLANWLEDRHPTVRTWHQVNKTHIQMFIADMGDLGYSDGYINNLYRAMQQYFKWFSDEEDVPNPCATLKPPEAGQKLVPVLDMEGLAALIKDAERKRDFESRRDTAILRLFACTGCRLDEIARLLVDRVDLQDRSALVMGKGRKERKVRFDYRAAQALDRYMRLRVQHKAAHLPELWLGVRRTTAMTPSGVYQMVVRRGERLGMHLHPHMFRHTFSHNWLDKGGAEGDLMELNGWTSPQMLRRYGASARAARAQRAYDRVDVMDGL